MTKTGQRSLSLIVPTYREAESLPSLIKALEELRDQLDIELILADDDSGDGTKELIAGMGKPWIKLLTRTQDRGLSPAVVDGLGMATHEYLAVMDADLSHPPETLVRMVDALEAGHDFVLGSRYVAGASTDEDWGLLRWVNSLGATLLALPLSTVRDPMSGFFALSKTTLARAPYLNPVGYKIGLELLVKCGCTNVAELPIHFSDRQFGESKLTLKQQLLYLQHLRRLYIFKYAERSHAAQFAVVGATGVAVNLTVLTGLRWVGLPLYSAVAGAIGLSMVTNFLLNQRFTFSYARHRSKWTQFVGFVSACSFGALVNYVITMWLASSFNLFGAIPQLAAVVGILAGTGLNYGINRYVIFHKRA